MAKTMIQQAAIMMLSELKSVFVPNISNYRQPCVASQPIMFCYGLFFLSAALRSKSADYVLRRFILFYFFFIFLFTVRSQKLLDRFTQNFQELCILV